MTEELLGAPIYAFSRALGYSDEEALVNAYEYVYWEDLSPEQEAQAIAALASDDESLLSGTIEDTATIIGATAGDVVASVAEGVGRGAGAAASASGVWGLALAGGAIGVGYLIWRGR